MSTLERDLAENFVSDAEISEAVKDVILGISRKRTYSVHFDTEKNVEVRELVREVEITKPEARARGMRVAARLGLLGKVKESAFAPTGDEDAYRLFAPVHDKRIIARESDKEPGGDVG